MAFWNTICRILQNIRPATAYAKTVRHHPDYIKTSTESINLKII